MNGRFLKFMEGDAGGGGGGGAPDGGGTPQGGGTLLGGQGGGSPPPGAAGTSPGQGTSDAGTATPFFRGLYSESGEINQAAFDRLPEHLKPYRSTFEKYKTVEALFGGIGNLASLAGKKGLTPLPEGADENAKKEFDSRLKEILGVPADPKAYGLVKPENIPDSMWDQAYVDEVAKVFQEENVSPAAAKRLVEMDAARGAAAVQKEQEDQAAWVQEQKQAVEAEFGADMERKLALAKATAQKLGADINDPALGDSSKFIIAMARAGALLGEDRLVDAGGQNKQGLSHRDQARDIVNNPANPKHEAYHKSNHPLHQQAIDEVTELNRLATTR